MNILSSLKTINLIVSASSDQMVRVRNMSGDRIWVPTRRAAIHELMRPPFILSAPTKKRGWTQKEIDEFYQSNPMMYGK